MTVDKNMGVGDPKVNMILYMNYPLLWVVSGISYLHQ